MKLCHGYLASQFIRPYNDRKWKFGGSWENRTRFPYTIFERLQKEIKDNNFIAGSKISMWEGFPGGCGSAGPYTPIMDLTESIDLIKGIEARGAKFILVSAGTPYTLALLEPVRKMPNDVYLHFGFQKIVKDVVKPETVVIGSAYSVFNNGNNEFQAVNRGESTLKYWGNKNIKDGVVDMIAIGRQALADSSLPVKMKEGKEDTIKWCRACDNCAVLLYEQRNVGCSTYDKEYGDDLRKIIKEKRLSKVSKYTKGR